MNMSSVTPLPSSAKVHMLLFELGLDLDLCYTFYTVRPWLQKDTYWAKKFRDQNYVMIFLALQTINRSMTKPTKWHVRQAKTQISLAICPVWSVFAVRMKEAWVLSYPLSAQRRLWSDWVDAQADLSLHWAQSFCWFCHKVAHMLIINFHGKLAFL